MNIVPLSPPAAAPARLHITGLKKAFGALPVLRGVDATMPAGQVTAIVGPNGSGKTTLIKSILGLVRPDGGRILLDGRPLRPDGADRARIGYMPQAARFPENLTGREVIALLKDLRGPAAPTDESLIDAFGLEPELDKPLRTLSGGNRQRVSAVLAFLFDPDLLILDEPTAGLDPVASSILKDKIRAAQDRGKTFILTSHIISEIEELADRIVFLLDGRVRFGGSIAEIMERTGQSRLERALAHLMTGKAA
ncbi:MAG: ABC transporter ATP-binding protein [Bacteroidetes bacterium]|nr:MAG: ABC transporter ATP-binding protein [Bacteroidota bacterium]